MEIQRSEGLEAFCKAASPAPSLHSNRQRPFIMQMSGLTPTDTPTHSLRVAPHPLPGSFLGTPALCWEWNWWGGTCRDSLLAGLCWSLFSRARVPDPWAVPGVTLYQACTAPGLPSTTHMLMACAGPRDQHVYQGGPLQGAMEPEGLRGREGLGVLSFIFWKYDLTAGTASLSLSLLSIEWGEGSPLPGGVLRIR